MNCMNCGSTNDATDFVAGSEKITLCVDCRLKLAKGNLELGKIGRPSLGITKKVSLTLTEDNWSWLDEKAEGNRSKFLREIVSNTLGNESEWDNYACLGYAILGAKKSGLNEKEINKLIKNIYAEFDLKSVEEANEIYRKSDY